MTMIAYDTEFLEDGMRIWPISIGLVADDGREYYAVFDDAPWDRIKANKWLRNNVWPSLPVKDLVKVVIHNPTVDGGFTEIVQHPGSLDPDSPFIKPKKVIRNEVRHFIESSEGHPELWADYGAYDHVMLAQLWGRMTDLPDVVPMHTNDLQTLVSLGLVDEPVQFGTSHNALDDARTVMQALHVIRPGEPRIKEKGLAEPDEDEVTRAGTLGGE